MRWSCVQVGDGSNFVVMFAGALLQQAEELLRTGLHPSEIISGYSRACRKVLEILDGQCFSSVPYTNRASPHRVSPREQRRIWWCRSTNRSS